MLSGVHRRQTLEEGLNLRKFFLQELYLFYFRVLCASSFRGFGGCWPCCGGHARGEKRAALQRPLVSWGRQAEVLASEARTERVQQ